MIRVTNQLTNRDLAPAPAAIHESGTQRSEAIVTCQQRTSEQPIGPITLVRLVC